MVARACTFSRLGRETQADSSATRAQTSPGLPALLTRDDGHLTLRIIPPWEKNARACNTLEVSLSQAETMCRKSGTRSRVGRERHLPDENTRCSRTTSRLGRDHGAQEPAFGELPRSANSSTCEDASGPPCSYRPLSPKARRCARMRPVSLSAGRNSPKPGQCPLRSAHFPASGEKHSQQGHLEALALPNRDDVPVETAQDPASGESLHLQTATSPKTGPFSQTPLLRLADSDSRLSGCPRLPRKRRALTFSVMPDD